MLAADHNEVTRTPFVAVPVCRLGSRGPLQALLAYAAAVLWALAGVVVNQYDASLLTTGTALLSVAVAAALVGALRRRRPHMGTDRSVRPRAA